MNREINKTKTAWMQVIKINATMLLVIVLINSLMPLTLFAQCGYMSYIPNFSFDFDGFVTTDFNNNSYDRGESILVQPDGKLVASGLTATGAISDFATLRYNTDGTLDQAFGVSGMRIVDIANTWDEAYDAALQSDGKIVVAGYSVASTGALDVSTANFSLIRLTPNGNLDTTFGKTVHGSIRTGKQTTDFFGLGDIATAVAIQSDGKIVVAGKITKPGEDRFAVARYNSNGVLDQTFSGDGKADFKMLGVVNNVVDLIIQPNGKLILVGTLAGDFVVLRVNIDGTLDTSFGTLGKTVIDFLPGFDTAEAAALQVDGKILVGGTTFNHQAALVRLNANGSIDPSFDGDGKATFNLTQADSIIGIGLTFGNLIYLGIVTSPTGGNNNTIAAYDPNSGCFYLYGGAVTGNGRPTGFAMKDDKIYLTGSSQAPSSANDLYIAAYEFNEPL